MIKRSSNYGSVFRAKPWMQGMWRNVYFSRQAECAFRYPLHYNRRAGRPNAVVAVKPV